MSLLLALNLVGAIVTLLVYAWGVVFGDHSERPRRAIVGGLAGFYVVMLAVQLATGAVMPWLSISRAVSPFTWALVWSWPVVSSTLRFRRMRRESIAAVTSARAIVAEAACPPT